MGARLAELCPDGINVFFDNVGGPILDAVLAKLALGARVALCGGISSGYTASDLPPGPSNYMQLVIRRSTMQGFLLLDYEDRYAEGVAQLREWVSAGKIHVEADVAIGLEKCPETLTGLFQGKNFGKQLLKITDPA